MSDSSEYWENHSIHVHIDEENAFQGGTSEESEGSSDKGSSPDKREAEDVLWVHLVNQPGDDDRQAWSGRRRWAKPWWSTAKDRLIRPQNDSWIILNNASFDQFFSTAKNSWRLSLTKLKHERTWWTRFIFYLHSRYTWNTCMWTTHALVSRNVGEG